jgi:hypothetical protein
MALRGAAAAATARAHVRERNASQSRRGWGVGRVEKRSEFWCCLGVMFEREGLELCHRALGESR